MKRFAVVACVAATLLTVASGAPAAGAADRDPCALLTRKEIARAFGQKASRPSRSLGPMFCQWVLIATPTQAPGQVNALLERGKAAKRDFRVAEDVAGPLVEPVEGLGKKAFFAPDSGTLFVLAPGPTLYYLQANVYDAEANRVTEGLEDALTRLATAAGARL